MTIPAPTPPPPVAPRLVGFLIRRDAELPAPFDRTQLVNMRQPEARHIGWSARVRGQVVFFVSPKGWVRGRAVNEWPKDGPVTILGPVPMSSITLIWEGEDIGKCQSYDSPPMQAARPQADEQPQIDPKDLGDP